MSFDVRNEVWGSHIVTADKITIIASLQNLFLFVCVWVCALHLMIFANGMWHVVCQRTHYLITLVAAHISLSCFYLVRWHETHLLPEAALTFLFVCTGVSFSHGIDLLCTADLEEEERKKGREAELLNFFECWSVICFLEGVVVQKQPAGEQRRAVPNRNRERDALIKNPIKALSQTHSNKHTHTIYICFGSNNSLQTFLFLNAHTYVNKSTLRCRCTTKNAYLFFSIYILCYPWWN